MTERQHAVDLLAQMLLIRRFEERSAELYSLGKIRGFLHLYIGEEAVAVGVNQALDSDDNIVATYREHAHALVRGTPPGAVMAEMFGKANGCSGGRGGSMHIFDVRRRFFGGHAIVGGGLPVAIGLALADKMRSRRAVTASFFGDGATDEGEFHEALNFAALWKLPVLFVCENNQYAMGTALARHAAETSLCVHPRAYGIRAEQTDGMDVLGVERLAREMAAEVRETGSPRFIELVTYRLRAHSMYDAELYRDKEDVQRWSSQHDPIGDFRAFLRAEHWLDDAADAELERRTKATVDDAVAFAEAGELEPVEELAKHLYTPSELAV